MAEVVSSQESVLGSDVHIKGTITFEHTVRVHGRLEGNATGPGRLHIAREGKVMGDVEAAEVVIEGDMRGDINGADRVELKSSAHYEGNLRASKLAIDAGAFFTGHVTVGTDGSKDRPAAAKQANAVKPGAATGKAEPQPAGK